ncbi:MAG TPA: Na+/H+ antiporter NhaA [Acetobacteraceae bacterium]|jgi:Na+:H+ antiporter, NhaA family|nr:Na+/H+ antiporter NhaA [Acetobacteraceae bacterium]
MTTVPPRRLSALLAFLRGQAAGGIALLGAAMVALTWSNASSADNYFRLMALPLGFLPLDLWINDGLMTLFFLTVSLEIRREITDGQLASRRKIAAPGLAALGGMVVPALIYAGFNLSDPVRLRGWAVPVATDIAFALAALSVLGRRVPMALKVFLTALAIIDDLGAIAVIALFYTPRLAPLPLAAACVICGGLYALRRSGVRAMWVYAAGGVALWACVLSTGIHPTIAGVALAFLVPMDDTGHRLEAGLGAWVTWLVLPLFGLANAGLRLDGVTLADFGTPVMLGIALALVIGKPAGVFGGTWIAVRLGGARMPAGLDWLHVFGVAALCGIGFTMSLFIGDLGFHGSPIQAEVKLAVFTGSVISAVLGITVLAIRSRSGRTPPGRSNPSKTPASP